jgi:putative membrane protein
MSTEIVTSNPAARRRKWLRWGALAAVVLVPLAFAGLFVGALSKADTGLERIPVAIVNEDSLIMTTAVDGTKSPVFAGRLLVTELTGDTEGFDWTITNTEQATAALERGDVYAILTIPHDFSRSILSLSSANPRKADISIKTDDAHSYLTGSVAQEVGQSMTATFGNEITSQYIGGIYANIGDLGSSLSEASDGASALATGATGLSTGLSTYTSGVSDLADGLDELDSGAAGLSQLTAGVSSYTGGVSQLSATLSSINAAIQSNATVDPTTKGTLQAVVNGLASTSASGAGLSQQLSGAISGIQSGISASANGASELAVGSPELVSGATQLASGATDLSDGLASGAGQVPSFDPTEAASAADIAADPVGYTVETDNAVTDVGQAIATFFVPLGLWVGALAVFLVLRPTTRRALSSTANNGRLVLAAIARAGVVTAAQALVLVGLLHGALGVGWNLLPATIAFSLVMALAFTAFHYLLTVAFGRAGLVVSLFALAVQLTATGGLYPVQLLDAPFQAISPFLPLTYAVSGMQGIIAGSGAGGVVVAALVLAAFGALSGVLALAAIRRTRRASALGLTPRPV